MPNIVIDLDKDTIGLLKTKADINRLSLEEQIRALAITAAPLTSFEKVTLSQRLRAAMPILNNFDVRAATRHGDDEFD